MNTQSRQLRDVEEARSRGKIERVMSEMKETKVHGDGCETPCSPFSLLVSFRAAREPSTAVLLYYSG